MTFKEAILHAKAIGIKEEYTDYDSDEIVLLLENGDELRFASNYDGPYSDDTPGNGITPPSVYLKRS